MAVTVAVLGVARVPRRWAPPWAVLRGAVQLAVIALVLRGVLTNGWWVAAALAVMFTVAASTSTRRLGFSWHRLAVVSGAMVVGVVVAVGIAFVTGALAFTPRYALALGGIIVGNSMSIATLAGRRLFLGVHDRWDEVEGWFALGATPLTATAVIRREAAFEALVPTIDQTRTTGLVTLPGAFVGSIFGGASPLDAGRFQIVVLACVLTAGSITAVLLLRALGPVRTKPVRPS
ncbi:MAG: ABC transporter permease [Promicromonosporaceae bacterium]|nr:ABC transporter permease [Promicromonosporaceae bacterium]